MELPPFPSDARQEAVREQSPASLATDAERPIADVESSSDRTLEDLVYEASELFRVRCELRDEIRRGASVPVAPAVATERPQRNVNELTDAEKAVLRYDFNVERPERYPAAVLRDTLSDSGGGPWGIVIVAKADHNGAFDRTPELEALHDDLGGRVATRVIEASTAKEAADLCDRLAQRFGRFQFAVCIAHGSEDGFALGDGDSGQVGMPGEDIGEQPSDSSSEEQRGREGRGLADSGGSLGAFADGIARNAEPGATVVMASCSTGDGAEPVARKLARRTGRKVVAPTADMRKVSLNASAVMGSVSFNPEYDTGRAVEFDGNEAVATATNGRAAPTRILGEQAVG